MIIIDTNILYDLLGIYSPVLDADVLGDMKLNYEFGINPLTVFEAVDHISKRIDGSSLDTNLWRCKLQMICDLRNDSKIVFLTFPNSGKKQITADGMSEELKNLELSMKNGIVSSFASDRRKFSEHRKRIEALFLTMYIQLLSLVIAKLLIEDSKSCLGRKISLEREISESIRVNLKSCTTFVLKNVEVLFSDDVSSVTAIYDKILREQYLCILDKIRSLDSAYQETATERKFSSSRDIWKALSGRLSRSNAQALIPELIDAFLSTEAWGYSQLGKSYLRTKLEKWTGMGCVIAKLRKNDTFDINIMGSADENNRLLTRDSSMLNHLRNQPECNAETLYNLHARSQGKPSMAACLPV